MNVKTVAESYDKTISSMVNQYENLPAEIIGHPDFPLFKEACESDDIINSGSPGIPGFLLPEQGMKFIDLGCSANLINYGLYGWPSEYYGVDASPKTVEVLKGFAKNHDRNPENIFCCGIHELPFDDGYFDIGACIGVLEYFESSYVKAAVNEIARVLNRGAKLVLDIPDWRYPAAAVMAKVEGFLGRPELFNISVKDFETLLDRYFETLKKTDGMMTAYYLRKK